MASKRAGSRGTRVFSTLARLLLLPSACWLSSPQASLAGPPPGVLWSSIVNYTDLAHVAADGTTLWFGTLFGGVVEWDTASQTYRSYTQSSHALPSNQIQDIAVDNAGAVWIATHRGLGERPAGAAPTDPWITHDETNSGLTDHSIMSVSADPAGGIWIGTYEGGLFHYDGLTWINYTVANSGLTDPFVTSTVTDLAGALWLGAWSDGVNRFDGVNWTRYTRVNTGTPPATCFPADPPDDLGLLSPFVWVRAVDPFNGAIWFWNDDDHPSCANRGVTRYLHGNWMTWSPYNSAILAGNTDVAIDSTGTTWLTSLSGIQSFDGASFTTYSPPDAPESARCAIAVGEDMWFGGPGGPSVHHQGEFTSFPLSGLASQSVSDVAFRSAGGAVEAWIAHGNGFQRFDGQTWTHFTPENSPLRVYEMRAVAVDTDGSLWVGSGVGNGGLYHYDGVNWEIYDSSNSALRSGGAVEAIAVDPLSGTKWFVERFDSGVVKFDGTQWTGYHAGGISGPCTPTGIPPRTTVDVEVDTNGHPWIATSCGATRFDGTTWTTIGPAEGLPGTTVNDLAVGLDGAIWAATNGGVGRIEPAGTVTAFLGGKNVRTVEVAADGRVWASVLNEFVAVYDGVHWIAYGPEHGLLDAHILFASAAHPEGPMWFGGSAGISIVESAAARDARDVDLSGAVNAADAIQVARCLGGPGPFISPECTPAERFNADIDEDGHVDLRDFAIAQRSASPQ